MWVQCPIAEVCDGTHQYCSQMSVLVNQADEQIDNIQTTAAGVQDNMEHG
jgi:hypothetical protein